MLSNVHDGNIITIPDGYRPVKTREQGRLLQMGRTDDLFFKQPTPYHFEATSILFPGFPKNILLRLLEMSPILSGQKPTTPIRRRTREEQPGNLENLRTRFPELANVTDNADHLHFLLLYKLQYERLKALFGPSIPEAVFVLLREPSGNLQPSVAQQAIEGHTLWEMVDSPSSAHLLNKWRQSGRIIAEPLQRSIQSVHVDCNLQNFVFSPDSGVLFYVDSKPTFFRTKRMNEYNKQAIRACLIDPYL